MSARVDLAELAALAEKAAPSPSVTWWTFDELDDGTLLATEEAAYFAALHPATVAALVRAVKAAQAEREAGLALWSRWILGEKEDDPRSKVYSDGTPHSVEEQARRLEEHIAAVEALAAALAPFAPGPGEETGE